MRIELIDVAPDKERVLALWRGFCERCEHSFFMSPGWMDTWIDIYAGQEPIKLLLATHNGEVLHAGFVCYRTQRRGGLIPSRVLNLSCTGDYEKDAICLEYNHLLNLTDRPFDINAFVRAIPVPWDEFYLPGLSVTQIPGKSIAGYDQRWVIRDFIHDNYHVDLDKAGLDREAYFSLLSKNTRSQLRRTYKYYEATGGVRLQQALSVPEALTFIGEMYALHEKRWQDKQAVSFLNEHFRRFSNEIVKRRFDKDEIQVLKLYTRAETIGYIYSFVYRGRVYFYQCGFNYHQDNKIRPGLVCHTEAIIFNAMMGQSAYDFLAGGEHYKERLATGKSSIIWVRLLNPGLKTRALIALRDVKEALRKRREASRSRGVHPAGEAAQATEGK